MGVHRPAGREQSEHRRRRRVDVSATVHSTGIDLLLGRHEGVGAHRALAGERAGAVGQVGDAEVGHLRHTALRQQHVGRLHVAVDDALGVGGGEAVEHRLHHLEGQASRHRAVQLQPVLEAAAAHELHHDVRRVLLEHQVVDRDDVRVLQPGHRLGLATKAPQDGVVPGQGGGQDLDRPVGPEPVIPGPPDLAHSAGPQARHELIATMAQGPGWLGHAAARSASAESTPPYFRS